MRRWLSARAGTLGKHHLWECVALFWGQVSKSCPGTTEWRTILWSRPNRREVWGFSLSASKGSPTFTHAIDTDVRATRMALNASNAFALRSAVYALLSISSPCEEARLLSVDQSREMVFITSNTCNIAKISKVKMFEKLVWTWYWTCPMPL